MLNYNDTNSSRGVHKYTFMFITLIILSVYQHTAFSTVYMLLWLLLLWRAGYEVTIWSSVERKPVNFIAIYVDMNFLSFFRLTLNVRAMHKEFNKKKKILITGLHTNCTEQV